MTFPSLQRLCAAALLALAATAPALAQEAVLRKALAERIPGLPKIDEVSKSPIPGLYEIRIGTDIYYADERGDYLVQGSIIDTKTRVNLTDARIDKLTAVDFAALPLKDALVIKQGNGQRKMAVFVDPNCGYCKRFERDLQKVDNVTIHMFLYPILGPDSLEKSKQIWCAKDAGKTWTDYMVREQSLAQTVTPACDLTAITRNVEFGRKYKINGTPTLLFADGSRVPGAISAAQVEKYLGQTTK